MKTNQTQPVIFVGHGSPMNIVANNVFTENMGQIANSIQKPKAILVISAHWITEGAKLTAAAKPKQIYDFGGFPEELYKIKYEPAGAPNLVKEFAATHSNFQGTDQWGLDHGSWAVLHRMYPLQDVPVMQLSMNSNYNVDQHLELARELKSLKQENILVLASGNIVHNLRQIAWDPDSPAKSWAIDFENLVLEALSNMNLSTEQRLEKIFSSELLPIAHPTLEHLIPLVYALGSADEAGTPEVLIKGIQNSSISMTSIKF